MDWNRVKEMGEILVNKASSKVMRDGSWSNVDVFAEKI